MDWRWSYRSCIFIPIASSTEHRSSWAIHLSRRGMLLAMVSIASKRQKKEHNRSHSRRRSPLVGRWKLYSTSQSTYSYCRDLLPVVQLDFGTLQDLSWGGSSTRKRIPRNIEVPLQYISIIRDINELDIHKADAIYFRMCRIEMIKFVVAGGIQSGHDFGGCVSVNACLYSTRVIIVAHGECRALHVTLL